MIFRAPRTAKNDFVFSSRYGPLRDLRTAPFLGPNSFECSGKFKANFTSGEMRRLTKLPES